MNPSNDDSSYQTNEMDPAQLDRFFKIVVKEDINEWVKYANNTKIEEGIIEFIKSNKEFLSVNDDSLIDKEEGTPSPRSWDMVDTIIKSTHILDVFFDANELEKKYNDVKKLIEFKVGRKVSILLFQFLQQTVKYTIFDFISDNGELQLYKSLFTKLQPTSHAVLANSISEYLKNNLEKIKKDDEQFRLYCMKIHSFLNMVDSSVGILLIQSMINSKDREGTNVFATFAKVFTNEILEKLNVSFESLLSLQGK